VMLDRFGIADLAGHYPRDLSVGQRQRVALAAVMVTRPGALLLDEPTRGLDYAAKQGLGTILQEWRDQGIAILLVTHDVELAATVADRVVLLQGGRITADGEPSAVLSTSTQFRPQVAELFPERGWLTVEDAWGHLKAHPG
jgi:ABC-type sulfate/molybdate transport systems ATPase subunit